jgi:phosphoribosylformylglycinamidine synthase
VGVTNCLNFGNPEKPEVYADLRDAIAGIREACTALSIPVVSGNVSLYNDTAGEGIDPTIVIGMVGLLEDVETRCTTAFAVDGDLIALAGPLHAGLAGSRHQRHWSHIKVGVPRALDLALEARMQAFIREAIAERLLQSAHDCSEGGLAVALAESCIAGGRGASVSFQEMKANGANPAATTGILFGEGQPRFLISYAREALVRLHELAQRHDVPFRGIGRVGGDAVHVAGEFSVPVRDLNTAYAGALAAGV